MKQIVAVLFVCITILLIVYFFVGPYKYIPVGSGETLAVYRVNRITQETTLLRFNDTDTNFGVNNGYIQAYHIQQ
jgi:hypothetical protein